MHNPFASPLFAYLCFSYLCIFLVSGSQLSNWYNSPQCSTDDDYCQVVCPYGTTLVNCVDVGNGTTLQPDCNFGTRSCTARPNPGQEGSPSCQIICQDPYPASPVQSDPPPISSSFCKRVVQYTFVITEEIMNLDGVNRTVLAINGKIPGPTLTISLGYSLHIHVINNLPSGVPVSFHWYGLPQLNSPYNDGVANITECPACPGQTIDYLFCPNVTGTYWYHSTVGSQRVDGLFGSIVIEDQTVDTNKYYDDERIVMFTEWYHRSSELIVDEINNMKWIGDFLPGRQSALVCNDVQCSGCAQNCSNCCSQQQSSNQRCGYQAEGASVDCSAARWLQYDVRSGQSYRFRFISAASSYVMRVSIDSHMMNVIAVDGNHMVSPQLVQFFDMSPGQRFDVIVDANQQEDNYWIRAEGPRNFGAYANLHYVYAPDIDLSETAAPNSIFMTQQSTQPFILLNLTSAQLSAVPPPTVEITMKIGCCENLTCTASDCSNTGALPPSLSSTPSPSKSPSVAPLSSPSFSRSVSPSPTATKSERKGPLSGKRAEIPPIFPGYTFGINDFNRTTALDSYCNYPDGLVKHHACWMRLLSSSTSIYQSKQPFKQSLTPNLLAAFEAGEKTFPPPPFTVVLNRGDQIRVVINNEDVHSVHSLHLHGHSFKLLAQSNQLNGTYSPSYSSLLNLKNPIERDTLLILPSSWAVIQFEAINPGTWYFHDQLQWNLMAGMGFVFNEITEELSLPPGNLRKVCGQCGGAPALTPQSSVTPSPSASASASIFPSVTDGASDDNIDSGCGLSTTLWVALLILCALISLAVGLGVTAGLMLAVQKKKKGLYFAINNSDEQ